MSCFQSEKGGGISCCFHQVVYDMIQLGSELESQRDETRIVSILYFNLNSILYYLHLNNLKDRRGKHHVAWTKE